MPTTTSIKARQGDGPIGHIEEFEIWSKDKEVPMIWAVHEEEVANNFGVSNEAIIVIEEKMKFVYLNSCRRSP